MDEKKKVIKTLEFFQKQISAFLKKASEEDIDLLLKGDKILSFVIKDKSSKNPEKNVHNFEDITSIVDHLKNFNTKEEGLSYLEENVKKKAKLEAILKHLDSHFSKSDNMEKLKEKIIDGTIGYRLRSKTVQGRKE